MISLHRLRRPALWSVVLITSLLPVAVVKAVPTSTATVTAGSTPALRINEVLAANTRIANGTTFPDLIELHNSSGAAVDLSGKSLTDDPLLPRKYMFPAGTSIAAGGYLVIYADDVTTAPGLHTGFSLDGEGDQVRLHDTPAAGGTLLDSIVFGFQVPDLSVSRTGASSNIWALTNPTAGAANNAALTLTGPAALRINEWAGNIEFRLDHDMIELFNTASQPVAIGGVRLTDDIAPTKGYIFPALSFVANSGYLPLYKGDYLFGLNGDRATVTLLGENNEQIDQITMIAQPDDRSSGRSPDGSANIVNFNIPSPGVSNTASSNPALFPSHYTDLLNNLRITEVMYQPQATSGSSDYEFVELQNIGSSTLDLGGVRFTNGLDYTFPAGTTLAAGAFIVVVNDRSSFLSRYPGSAGFMAPQGYNGSLDNSGETIALTLPEPWKVHILRFRYEPDWYASTAGGGNSLVIAAPFTATPQSWGTRATWRASAAVNGSPGVADPGTPGGGGGGSPTTARLSNLSVRTAMAAGQNLIVGFFVDGGSRSILVRAAGPALTVLGVPGAMTDPRLDLYNGSTLVLSNEDWPASLATTFSSVGAFAFPAGSRDAAFLQPIGGSASVHARGTGAGILLVEAYDTGAGNSPRLTNVSARNQVGTGDNILIAGFNIAGTGTKQLLLRAVGPKLAAFGVTGFLVDPKLELYSGSTKLTENDSWTASLATTFTAVGAFQLDAGSRDAALLTTLAPGAYTVQVSGVNNGTGEALIEIYEVP